MTTSCAGKPANCWNMNRKASISPSLGKFDLTGDGVEDIYLIPSSQDIPAEADKEANSLGKKLVYYRTGTIDDGNATVYLKKRDQRQYTDHPGLRDLHGAEVLLPADSETRDGPEPPVRTPAFRMGIKSNEKHNLKKRIIWIEKDFYNSPVSCSRCLSSAAVRSRKRKPEGRNP